MDVQLKKGLLEICVLRVLKKQDSYGYEIISLLEDVLVISEATLYPILKRMQNQNLVETYSVEHNSRLRKYYKITALGIEKLIGFKEEYAKLDKVYQFVLGDD